MEQRCADTVVVIGVHSAKFPEEQATAAVSQAVRRHNVRHPVVNDRDFHIWREYAVRAWPTLMFIDPQGKVIGRHEGEATAAELGRVLDVMVAEFDRAGVLDRHPLDLGPTGAAAQPAPPGSPLAFPGKVAVDERGRGHIVIADSNHHRLVIMGLAVQDGAVHHMVGAGEPGWRDGPAVEAQFNWPQGMAVDPRTGVVYVADTENHCIRRVSPADGSVTTIAGTGRQRRGLGPAAPAPAAETDLSSPWDLALLPDPRAGPPTPPNSHEDPHDDRGLLFIAMAGTHQIWTMALAAGSIGPYAGTGREALIDGPRTSACFAQPSGLALDPAREALYVADSETSAIREIDLKSGRVRTLVGTGLFDFGDVDGIGDDARLQHPLGIAVVPPEAWGEREPVVAVADTYNHKLRKLYTGSRRVVALAGGHPAGLRNGGVAEARFAEPGGLAYARGQLFVADTNNHAIRMVDLPTLAVRQLEIDESRRAHPEQGSWGGRGN